MNANELADKLSDKTMRDYIVFEYLPEIVSMLRKQQESIEELNRDYDLLFAEHQLLLKQEPVAMRYDFDGYGYQYIDSGTGSDWQNRVQGEPLYTAPQPEQEPVAWMTINEYGEEDDIHYENPEGHLLEGWTYKPLYTHPPTIQLEKEPIEYWNAVEGWVKLDEVKEHFDSVGCGTIYKTSGEDRVPLYTKPQIKGCAECGVNDNNHALYCVACAERYLKDKNTKGQE